MQYVYDDYYSKKCPDGYKYTQFKKYVKEYRERHDYSYHNTYEPGKEWQIDFAGDALWLTDRKTGERQKLVVLVCVMPYKLSGYWRLSFIYRANASWPPENLGNTSKFSGHIGCTCAITANDGDSNRNNDVITCLIFTYFCTAYWTSESIMTQRFLSFSSKG